jgi:hypothetical protein
MISTSTLTRTGLRLELVGLEMQSLNDRSLRDRLLNEIIAHCVPLTCLDNFTIWGLDEDEARMRLEVRIDYDEHQHQVELSGDGVPDDLAGSYTLDDGPTGRPGSGPMRRHCPHMGKAVELYMRLVKEQGLRLVWTVRFRERREEMCKKFGLVPAAVRDGTVGAPESTITNSLYSELIATGRVSSTPFPSG